MRLAQMKKLEIWMATKSGAEINVCEVTFHFLILLQ